MQDLADKITQKIIDSCNVLLVGPSDSGKTWFAKHDLINTLKQADIRVAYFENCDVIDGKNEADCFMIDEVEIMGDRNYLESKYGLKYFNDDYLDRVALWHNKLSKIKKPSIFIVTRNNKDEINYLKENYKFLEWNNSPVSVFIFKG